MYSSLKENGHIAGPVSLSWERSFRSDNSFYELMANHYWGDMNENKDILIVEESLKQAIQLQSILEKQNFNVTIATDKENALRHLGKNPPDLVISETNMSNMDGFELCRYIKATPAFK
jgi:PleD family two-component response regulator